jgi:hypothetical protein
MHSMISIPTPERLAVTAVPSAGVRAIIERGAPGGSWIASGWVAGNSGRNRETRVDRGAVPRKCRGARWRAGSNQSEFVTFKVAVH